MDWQPIETAPTETRVMVSHEMDPASLKIDGLYGPTVGVLRNDTWQLSAYFLCTDMRLRKIPTHWQPLKDHAT